MIRQLQKCLQTLRASIYRNRIFTQLFKQKVKALEKVYHLKRAQFWPDFSAII